MVNNKNQIIIREKNSFFFIETIKNGFFLFTQSEI